MTGAEGGFDAKARAEKDYENNRTPDDAAAPLFAMFAVGSIG
jgi:hypothetical protein